MKAISLREWRWALAVAALAVALSTAPYIYAYLTTPPSLHFSGLLGNPLDGYTYLAKMQEGARGEWLFHLPYTPEPHEGGLVYTFYLALGHLVSLLAVPPILVFHLARIGTGLALLLVGYAFIAQFSDDIGERRVAFALLAFSSGLGWLVAASRIAFLPVSLSSGLGGLIPTGGGLSAGLSTDVTIPEAITFNSLVVSPHFPLWVALLLVILLGILVPLRGSTQAGDHELKDASWLKANLKGFGGAGRIALLILAPPLLVAVQPLGLLTLVAAVGLYLAWRWLVERRLPWVEIGRTSLALAAAAPLALYVYWLMNTNPAMRAWMAQNLTLSPPPWDYVLGYGLVLALAVPGAWDGLRRADPGARFLVSWVVATALLLYAPFTLQRRLSSGLHVPLVILAAWGICRVVVPRLRGGRWLTAGLVGATTLTNLMVVLILLVRVVQRDPRIYLSRDEWAALGWLHQNVPADAVVLAGPQTGGFIPAWAGQRVVYGHWSETLNAVARQAQVESYFGGGLNAAAQVSLLQRETVGWVWLGPRERALGSASMVPFVCLVPDRTIGAITLYRVDRSCLAE